MKPQRLLSFVYLVCFVQIFAQETFPPLKTITVHYSVKLYRNEHLLTMEHAENLKEEYEKMMIDWCEKRFKEESIKGFEKCVVGQILDRDREARVILSATIARVVPDTTRRHLSYLGLQKFYNILAGHDHRGRKYHFIAREVSFPHVKGDNFWDGKDPDNGFF